MQEQCKETICRCLVPLERCARVQPGWLRLLYRRASRQRSCTFEDVRVSLMLNYFRGAAETWGQPSKPTRPSTVSWKLCSLNNPNLYFTNPRTTYLKEPELILGLLNASEMTPNTSESMGHPPVCAGSNFPACYRQLAVTVIRSTIT